MQTSNKAKIRVISFSGSGVDAHNLKSSFTKGMVTMLNLNPTKPRDIFINLRKELLKSWADFLDNHIAPDVAKNFRYYIVITVVNGDNVHFHNFKINPNKLFAR